MATGSGENLGSVIAEALGSGLSFAGKNLIPFKQQEKENTLKDQIAALQFARDERDKERFERQGLEHQLKMETLGQQYQIAALNLARTTERAAMTDTERAVKDAETQAAGARTLLASAADQFAPDVPFIPGPRGDYARLENAPVGYSLDLGALGQFDQRPDPLQTLEGQLKLYEQYGLSSSGVTQDSGAGTPAQQRLLAKDFREVEGTRLADNIMTEFQRIDGGKFNDLVNQGILPSNDPFVLRAVAEEHFTEEVDVPGQFFDDDVVPERIQATLDSLNVANVEPLQNIVANRGIDYSGLAQTSIWAQNGYESANAMLADLEADYRAGKISQETLNEWVTRISGGQ